jgi:hypothetical protein
MAPKGGMREMDSDGRSGIMIAGERALHERDEKKYVRALPRDVPRESGRTDQLPLMHELRAAGRPASSVVTGGVRDDSERQRKPRAIVDARWSS